MLPRDTVLIDEKVAIVLSGLEPGTRATIRLAASLPTGRMSSSAAFVADAGGRVDLAHTAPVAGSYATPDAMGLFWSAEREPSSSGFGRPRASAPLDAPVPWELTAEVGGRVVASDTVWRRAVSPDVRITRVREAGVVGTLYEPAGAGRRPAVVVLSGSQGGTVGPAGPPGGLASRGYVVLALAYFGDEGVPERLSRIPLEYLERAMRWLGARDDVDPRRLAVLGTSRGAELALLLGATYPELVRAVVAVSPSAVAWPGCCDAAARAGPAWTLGGAPVPYVLPAARARPAGVRGAAIFRRRLADDAAAGRAAIPVERIAGPILLVSGRADRVWPSYEMGEQVMARLGRHGFAHAHRHLAYEGAGHAILRPYGPTMGLDDQGGTPAAQAFAREHAWAALLEFLDEQLRRAAAPGESRAP